MGRLNICLLSPLAATAEQDDKSLTILAEVNAIAGAEVETEFGDSGTYAFCGREVALFHAQHGSDDANARSRVELDDSIPVRSAAACVDVLPHLDHERNGNVGVTARQGLFCGSS